MLAAFGRPVVPLEYIRNSGASAGICAGRYAASETFNASFTTKSRPSTKGVLVEYWPGYLCHTAPSRPYTLLFSFVTAVSAFSL